MKIILLVEDNNELRESMLNLLNDEGYTVVEARNGMEGIRLFKELPKIDAVITDLEMPMMNGVQLVGEIRAIESRVPIFMWSGSSNPNVKGLTKFFEKVTGAKEILRALKEVA